MATLARWNDRDGRSSGWWLVREVPGLCIYKSHPSLQWCVQALNEKALLDPMFNLPAEAERVWGTGADLGIAEAFLSQDFNAYGYPTREAARQAVGRKLARLCPQQSALSALL